MLSESLRQKGCSKKASFQISKYQYHLANTLPELLPETTSIPHDVAIQRRSSRKGKLVFHNISHTTEGIGNLDKDAILQSARKLYFDKDCIKISETSFKKNKTYKNSVFSRQETFHEVIEIHLIDNRKKPTDEMIPLSLPSAKGKENEEPMEHVRQIPLGNFELFVVHHCEGQGARWQHFVERYHLLDEKKGGEIQSKIHYNLLLTYQEEQGFLSFFSNKEGVFQQLLSEYATEKQKTLHNLQRMQGFLLLDKERLDRQAQQLSHPSFQENHKRWLRLPSEHYREYTQIRKQALAVYEEVNLGKKRHPDEFLNNLICRYMYAKEYNFKESMEGVTSYIKWEHNLNNSYDLTSFQHYHSKDFFSYMGTDHEGRAVVLNRASHLNFTSLQNPEQYNHYYIYFLQIWIQKKLNGYADQYTVIADLENLSTDNFKLSITQRNVGDSLKFSPQRQFKLLIVNASVFAHMIWKFLKPLIPKRTLHKLNIIGSDKKQIFEALSREMDPSVIPEYLGGTNQRNWQDDLREEKEWLLEKGQL